MIYSYRICIVEYSLCLIYRRVFVLPDILQDIHTTWYIVVYSYYMLYCSVFLFIAYLHCLMYCSVFASYNLQSTPLSGSTTTSEVLWQCIYYITGKLSDSSLTNCLSDYAGHLWNAYVWSESLFAGNSLCPWAGLHCIWHEVRSNQFTYEVCLIKFIEFLNIINFRVSVVDFSSRDCDF